MTEEEERIAGDVSGSGRKGLLSSHQQAAMKSCHSCQGLWEIFCQSKANFSSFSRNRTVRLSYPARNVESLELRATLKTVALKLPCATCNKGPSVRHTGQNRELLTCFSVQHLLNLSWKYPWGQLGFSQSLLQHVPSPLVCVLYQTVITLYLSSKPVVFKKSLSM